jgi:hypothetical protein
MDVRTEAALLARIAEVETELRATRRRITDLEAELREANLAAARYEQAVQSGLIDLTRSRVAGRPDGMREVYDCPNC